MEAVGFLLGILLFVKNKGNASYLGSPLVNFSSMFRFPTMRELKEFKWPDSTSSVEENLNFLKAFVVMSSSNAVFLLIYFSKIRDVTPLLIALGVLAFGGLILLSYGFVMGLLDECRAAHGGFCAQCAQPCINAGGPMLLVLLLAVLFVCNPTSLELLEGAVLLKSEFSTDSPSDSTIVLVILDFMIIAPFALVPLFIVGGVMLLMIVIVFFLPFYGLWHFVLLPLYSTIRSW